jgi:hypothetical protein
VSSSPPAPAALLGIAQELLLKGWQPVWWFVKHSGGGGVVGHCTGAYPYPTVEAQPQGPHRLGFRMPPNVVALDVDHYDDKHGGWTWDAAQERLGELPDTYKVTSRDESDISGRYLFRKPEWLQIKDKSLSEFGHTVNGKRVTDLDILRTGHRFSWAPGDVNPKTDTVVRCYDPTGEPCDMPLPSDLPELPEAWVAYLTNPPETQSAAYDLASRPSDGPQWWLGQPDQSLGTRAELAEFAFNLMASRLTPDEAMVQIQRVALAIDPGRPWLPEHLAGLVDRNTESKVGEILAREDAELAQLPATEQQLQDIADRTTREHDRIEKLRELRDERIYEAVQQLYPVVVAPLETTDSAEYDLPALIRGTPEYDQQFRRSLARIQADKDVALVLAAEFTGYKAISQLEEPPLPNTLIVTGKDSIGTCVIGAPAVTVLSGARAAGKTWCAATWAAQELRAGNHVIWIDFERQARRLMQKMRALKITDPTMDNQLHYTAALPSAKRLAEDVKFYAYDGAHRVLVVIDAFRGLQNLIAPGTSSNDGDAVEQVYLEYLNPMIDAGANVALLDHLPKSGGATIGAERKESAADYVIKVEQTIGFTKTEPGFSMMTLTKDRGGDSNKDAVCGYLWMPGDGRFTGAGITKYPDIPEFRNWQPDYEPTIDDAVNPVPVTRSEQTRATAQARRQAVIAVVRENPLRWGTRELAPHMSSGYADLFDTEGAARSFIDRMRRDGELTQDAGKKLDLPVVEDKREEVLVTRLQEETDHDIPDGPGGVLQDTG